MIKNSSLRDVKKIEKFVLISISALFFNFNLVAPAEAVVTVSAATSSLIVSWGGGTLATSDCSSNLVLTSVTTQTVTYVSGTSATTMTQTKGSCGTLATDGLTIASANTSNLSTYGSSAGSNSVTASCSGSGSVITGVRVFESTNGFTAGVKLLCGNLPGGGTYTLDSTSVGDTTPTTTSDLKCPAGSVASGLYIKSGSIVDAFGIRCAQVLGVSQTISISSLGTSSKTYPYSQSLSMATSGTVGTGAITYSVANGTALGCTLSNSSSTGTITATKYGTCLITASIASDTNTLTASSSSSTFTFNAANQSALNITTTTGAFGTALNLATSGGSSSGSVSYASVDGSTTCTVSIAQLTASSNGTCLVTATKAGDDNYNSVNSTQTTITFSQTASTSTISMASSNVVFRQTNNLTAVANVAGKVSFKANNVWISGCRNLPVSAGNSYTAICPYRPLLHGYITVTVTLTPTNSGYLNSSASTSRYYVKNRTNTR